ncbi:serine/threonine protein kinase [Thermogymnomonas acidicola]|uniref:non-specific serine/threonine protein kinase n=1 Tax=Thermogymnomonas acidicola TaxID=399579 RepID=A0AA37F9A5_9ARCH|nr:serine protein kinase RIO [Thermogymnomonas acidicola]GGM72283.1 serine/threonine protein kinase [Thermogymnomonas acidicola]
MTDEELSALERLIRDREFWRKYDLDYKTESLVFDRRTLQALYDLMHRNSVPYIDFPISSGKESVVFKAYMSGKPVAIKVFKMTTLKFHRIWEYIEGDQRFAKERIDRSRYVYIWCRKEYTNLSEMQRAGVRAPRPIDFERNVMMMSYLGTKQRPAPQIRNYEGARDLFGEVVEQLVAMYKKAKLVHADLSEYNILVHRRKPYFIDVAQAVRATHPSAEDFLRRDVHNVCTFFRKQGVDADPAEVLSQLGISS